MKTFSLCLFIVMLSCTKRDKPADSITNQTDTNKTVPANLGLQLEVKIYSNESDLKGWGYDIYNDGQIYIHQPNIPAIPGNRGFSSQQHAKTIGEFAVYKIRNNIMPPTISVEELDSLGVLK